MSLGDKALEHLKSVIMGVPLRAGLYQILKTVWILKVMEQQCVIINFLCNLPSWIMHLKYKYALKGPT